MLFKFNVTQLCGTCWHKKVNYIQHIIFLSVLERSGMTPSRHHTLPPQVCKVLRWGVRGGTETAGQARGQLTTSKHNIEGSCSNDTHWASQQMSPIVLSCKSSPETLEILDSGWFSSFLDDLKGMQCLGGVIGCLGLSVAPWEEGELVTCSPTPGFTENFSKLFRWIEQERLVAMVSISGRKGDSNKMGIVTYLYIWTAFSDVPVAGAARNIKEY